MNWKDVQNSDTEFRARVARENTLTTDEAITLLVWEGDCLSEIEKRRLTAFAVWLDRYQPNRPYGAGVMYYWQNALPQ